MDLNTLLDRAVAEKAFDPTQPKHVMGDVVFELRDDVLRRTEGSSSTQIRLEDVVSMTFSATGSGAWCHIESRQGTKIAFSVALHLYRFDLAGQRNHAATFNRLVAALHERLRERPGVAIRVGNSSDYWLGLIIGVVLLMIAVAFLLARPIIGIVILPAAIFLLRFGYRMRPKPFDGVAFPQIEVK